MEALKGKSIVELAKHVNIIISIFIVRDDKILQIEEAKKEIAGLWNFPSGKVEFGETLLEAATREAKEETGYEVKITNLCSMYYSLWDEKDGVTVRFNFWGEINLDAKPDAIAKDVSDMKWFTPEEITKMFHEKKQRSRYTLEILQDIKERKTIPLYHLREWMS